MNLINALKTDKPFRRLGWSLYQGWITNGWEGVKALKCYADILADDWEVQEKEVTITARKFWEAAVSIGAVLTGSEEPGALISYSVGPKAYCVAAALQQLAKELGL